MYILVEIHLEKPKKKLLVKALSHSKRKNGFITFQGKIIWVLPSEVNCHMQFKHVSEKTVSDVSSES